MSQVSTFVSKMKFLKHEAFLAFVVAVFSSFTDITNAVDSGCGTADWLPYKNERCFRILDDTLRTFEDAEKACTKLESTSTLPIIRTVDEQNFLANYLFKVQKKVDNFWLGAKFEHNSYKWQDKSALTFTNWATAARNMTDYCVQIQADVAVLGKWIDGPCEKKNLVVCEKSPSFTVVHLHGLLVDARKEFRDALDAQKHQLDEANKKIVEQKQQLAESNKNITDLKQSLIPIGFIYTQLPSDKAPNEIWPWMTWTDVSSTYEGVFFRVTGGDAAPIGQVQEDNAPRVTKIITEFYYSNDGHGERIVTKNAWTEPLFTGNYNTNDRYYIKFFTSGGEVRPRNMAIRIWKRIS